MPKMNSSILPWFEGSVLIQEKPNTHNDSISSLLKPGHNAEWDKNKRHISVYEADVTIYTAWLKGRIVFRHMPFNNIIKKLERYYNVTITNKNKKLDKELFTASFDIETIEQVFKTFKESYGMDYSINNNEVIIY